MEHQLFLPFDAPQQLLEPDEIFQLEDPRLLQLIEEDSRLERKPGTYSARALGEYISMWANTPPNGGLLVLGIGDDGTILGCKSVATKHLNDLERVADIYCPDARIQIRRIAAENSKGELDFLILILVRYRLDRVVRTSSGDAFIRRGDSKRQLTEEEIRELEIDRGQLDLEQEPTTLSYPADFDQAAIRDFVETVRTTRGLNSSHTAEQILQMRHLGRVEKGMFRPNNACALLFAKNPRAAFSGCRIRFLRFEGETEGTGERFNVVKDVWIEGTVPEILRQMESVLDGQLREFSRLGPDSKFYTAPEYPKEAWYEAIVNAVVHRSYGLKNMHVQVKMFDDRLEIVSPGSFPPLVSPENIYEVQHSRNPYLMDGMFYLEFVKMANEGTRRMRDRMLDAGLPQPEFSEISATSASVRVVLRNNIKQRKVWLDADASHVVGAAVFAGLTQDQKRLVNWVAENGTINVSQAQRLITAKTWHSAKKILRGLVRLGILKYVHRDDIERDPKAHFVLSNGVEGNGAT